MTVKQISVFLENKPGKLADFTKLISKNEIDIRALNIVEASDFGIIRMIVEDVYNAITVLKDADYICSTTDVIAVEIKDEVGALADLITVLSSNGINIEYMYAVTASKNRDTYMIIRADDQTKAIETLEKAGKKVASAETLFKK